MKYDLKLYRPIGPSLSMLVSGLVLAPDHTPVSDVRISTDSGSSALSDEEGKFIMRLQEGTSILTLTSDQYGTKTLSINVVKGEDNYYEVNFGDPSPHPKGGGGGGCFINEIYSGIVNDFF